MIQQQLNKKSSVLKVPGMNIQVRSTWEILVLEVADVWEKGCLMEKNVRTRIWFSALVRALFQFPNNLVTDIYVSLKPFL